MRRHITVNGRPWCQCGWHELGGREASQALMDKAEDAGVFVICMGSQPSDVDAVAFLQENGIPAQLTDGVCPTLLEAIEPQP